MTDDAFHQGIAVLSTTFQGLDVSPKRLEVWRALLDDLSDDIFLSGVQSVCRQRTELYPGTNLAALIREYAGHGGAGRDAIGLLAFETARQAIGRIGPYDSVSFTDPAITATVRTMGGWPEFCEMDQFTHTAMQREFVALYAMYAARGPAPAVLRGLHAINNTATGHFDAIAPPITVLTIDEQGAFPRLEAPTPSEAEA